ncbi:nucleotidyl transferase AbiEii/AbiGii toxin family protein [Elongatibacter sediminis]|uniref:Nucleotidyl transferase AbiEii/AbiGii toxin family protein n=1 Tax=Elongatibacter sediminis TaxID=3119006 RepID=A0AAW9RHU8_9GAMM
MTDRADYERQVRLLVRVLPYVAEEKAFALKGGTAINLFLRDMPRLSVDIDLTYLPIANREQSLHDCRAALQRIGQSLETSSPQIATAAQSISRDQLRLLVSDGEARIKVEVSPVLRGTLHPPIFRDIHPRVADRFGFARVAVLDEPDLYGGKICAALDRQHPRDWFDVMLLLRENGFTRATFEGFLVYLISHNRSMADLLEPRLQDLSAAFENQFQGMTEQPVLLHDLVQTRSDLLKSLSQLFTANDKSFLLSVKQGEPNWSLLPLPGVSELPAVRWKLQNIRAMSQLKHKQAVANFKDVLNRL